MAARTKNSAVNLEITNTNDGFDIVGGNNNTGSIGVYSGSIDIIADSSATNLTYTFPSVSDVLVGTTASQTLTNKTLTDPSVDGITEEPTFARVLLYDLSSQKLGYTASSAFGGGGGGGGTPGGSDTYIQYNESGVFGGESNLTWNYTANRFSVTGSTILNGAVTASSTIYAPNIGTGTDNSVVILDTNGFLKTDEIDSRVWGSTLVDYTGTNSNNQIASFTDTNTITGESNLTFDGTLLTVTGRANVTTSITSSTAQLTGLTSQAYNRVVVSDSNGNLAYTASSAFGGGGGGGTPGGSDKQIQYNDGGNFGGEANLTWDYDTNTFSVTGSTILNGSVFAPIIGAGVDNSVVILDSDGSLRTDEIDSRVWGTTLVDGTNGVNNRIATFTDANSLNGEANLTFDGTLLTVTGRANISTSITASTAQFTGLTQQSSYNRVLVSDTNGNLAYTASSAFGGGGGSSDPTTGVSRSFYMPAIGGEYNTSVTETTSSFGGFTSRYLLMQLNETPSAVDYTLSMPNEWLTTSNINVRLHLVVSGSTTGGPIFGVGMTSVDDNESFSSISSPTYVTASANYSGYTALDKYDLKINNITIAGSPTTSSIILMKIRRETDDEFTHSIPFIGFEIQYTENTTLPSSF